MLTYPLCPGGLHYKRPHYLPVTQSNLQALLISKAELVWPFMIMSQPPCSAGQVLGQRDNKTEAGVPIMSLKEEESNTYAIYKVLQMHFVAKVFLLYGWKPKILQSTVNLWHINSVLLFYCLVIVGWTKDAFTTGVCFAEKEWKQGIFHCNIKESVCDDPGTRLNIL